MTKVPAVGERLVALDVPETSARLLLVVVRLLRMLRRDSSRPVGHSAVSALAVIAENGPLRVGDLAAREGVTAPSITRVLGHLEAAGYITRDPDPHDGRAALVRVTDAGVRQARAAWERQGGGLAERLAAMSPEQVGVLHAALPVLESLAADQR